MAGHRVAVWHHLCLSTHRDKSSKKKGPQEGSSLPPPRGNPCRPCYPPLSILRLHHTNVTGFNRASPFWIKPCGALRVSDGSPGVSAGCLYPLDHSERWQGLPKLPLLNRNTFKMYPMLAKRPVKKAKSFEGTHGEAHEERQTEQVYLLLESHTGVGLILGKYWKCPFRAWPLVLKWDWEEQSVCLRHLTLPDSKIFF